MVVTSALTRISRLRHVLVVDIVADLALSLWAMLLSERSYFAILTRASASASVIGDRRVALFVRRGSDAANGGKLATFSQQCTEAHSKFVAAIHAKNAGNDAVDLCVLLVVCRRLSSCSFALFVWPGPAPFPAKRGEARRLLEGRKTQGDASAHVEAGGHR